MEKARLTQNGALEILRQYSKEHAEWNAAYCCHDRQVLCSLECPLLKIQIDDPTGQVNYRLGCGDKCLYVGYPTPKDIASKAVEKLQ